MDKLLEVREYDIITANTDYKNDNNFKYLPKDVFAALVEFIHGFAGDEENADSLDFFRVGYKRNVGDTITVKNYVGLIEMQNGYQIQVLPKITFGESGDLNNANTKKTFLKMLRSMKGFPSKVFNDASLKIDRMNLYEIFINMYLQEVRLLVKHGIKSAYVQHEDNLRYYKGKLQVSRHIYENATHKERFYVAYDEFHPDCTENKLIKATLMKLNKITTSADNAKEIRQLLTAFGRVEPSANYQKDFDKVTIDRNNNDYKMIMPWSKVFLMNKSFSIFSGKDHSRALLFPMESIYESYVAKYMKKVMTPDGWSVSSQDKGHFLFTEPRKQFSLRPDLVLQKEGRTVIMDTKWKKLFDNDRKNYGISQADMYQMYAYSKKYKTSEIWLLYPLNDEMKGHEDICFDSGDGTTVCVLFVDIANIEDSLNELKKRLNKERGCIVMDDINHVYDFAVKWIEKFKDPNTNAMELTDHYMADDCKELGFEMDCGHAFKRVYGNAAYDSEALSMIIDEVTDITLLGSAIYSRWRYFNHWAYTGEEIMEPKNRKWFILALERLAAISGKNYSKSD